MTTCPTCQRTVRFLELRLYGTEWECIFCHPVIDGPCWQYANTPAGNVDAGAA